MDGDDYSITSSMADELAQQEALDAELAAAQGNEFAQGEGEVPFEPLWKEWDRKAYKEGPRSTIHMMNGDKYEGSWHRGKPHGQGTMRYKNGKVLEGSFAGGKPHGAATLWIPRESESEGQSTGPVRLRLLYRGQFNDGKKQGRGIMHFVDGREYNGEWVQNQREGTGTMRYPNGDRYEGNWLASKRSGPGTLFLANGDVFQGEWLDDMKDGPGTFFYVGQKKRYDGVWKEDTAKCGLFGAIDNGDGRQCDVKLPPLELANPVGILNTEAHALEGDRAGRVAALSS